MTIPNPKLVEINKRIKEVEYRISLDKEMLRILHEHQREFMTEKEG